MGDCDDGDKKSIHYILTDYGPRVGGWILLVAFLSGCGGLAESLVANAVGGMAGNLATDQVKKTLKIGDCRGELDER